MVVQQYVNSLQELEVAVGQINDLKVSVDNQQEQKPEIFVIVSGEKDASGKSWCPDCVKGINMILTYFLFI
jgi:hypothetical protein